MPLRNPSQKPSATLPSFVISVLPLLGRSDISAVLTHQASILTDGLHKEQSR
jgi:hypothetical protein